MFFSQIYLAMFALGAAILVCPSLSRASSLVLKLANLPTFHAFSELSIHQKLKKNLLQVVKNPNEEIHMGFYYL